MLGLGGNLITSKFVESFANTYSVLFDGTDDFIQVDSVGADMNGATGTISMWLNIPTGVSGWRMPIKAINNSSNLMQIVHAPSTDLRFTYKAAGVAAIANTTSASFEGAGWVHLMVTWEDETGAGEVKLYLNGNLEETATLDEGGTWAGTISEVDLGRNTADGSYLDGGIDEVSIFTSVKAIGDIYNSGVVKDLSGESGLVGYWRLEEGTGTSIADDSGNSNTGTLTGVGWQTDVP